MDASYRRPLIAQEVLAYNADIVCLQEVDEKAFSTYFLPVMKHAGGLTVSCSYLQALLKVITIVVCWSPLTLAAHFSYRPVSTKGDQQWNFHNKLRAQNARFSAGRRVDECL